MGALADVFAALSEVATDVDRLIHEQIEPLLAEITTSTPEVLGNLKTLTADLNESVNRINGLLSPRNTGRIENINELIGHKVDVALFLAQRAVGIRR